MPEAEVAVANLLLDEARRQVVRQNGDLDTLRSKVATILAGSSIAAAVFGAALRKHPPTSATVVYVLALVVFAITVTLCIIVMLPRKWEGEHSSVADWIEEWSQGDTPDPARIALSFADGFEKWRAANHDTLAEMQTLFAWTCGLLGLQVALWATAVLIAAS